MRTGNTVIVPYYTTGDNSLLDLLTCNKILHDLNPLCLKHQPGTDVSTYINKIFKSGPGCYDKISIHHAKNLHSHCSTDKLDLKNLGLEKKNLELNDDLSLVLLAIIVS